MTTPEDTPEPWQVLARELRRAGWAYDLSIEDAHDCIAALDAAGYQIVPKAERPTLCPTCATDCEQFGRCPDPWHGGVE